MAVGAVMVAVLVGAGVLVLAALPASPDDVADVEEARPEPPGFEVETTSCDPGADGRATATGTVRNTSSVTSDYAIQVAFGPDGGAVAYVRSVEPTTSRTWSVTSDQVGALATCAVDGRRWASSAVEDLCGDADPTIRDVLLGVDADGLCDIG